MTHTGKPDATSTYFGHTRPQRLQCHAASPTLTMQLANQAMPVCRSDLVEARHWCLEVTSCAKFQVKSRASTTQIHRLEVQVSHQGRTATVCSHERLKSPIQSLRAQDQPAVQRRGRGRPPGTLFAVCTLFHTTSCSHFQSAEARSNLFHGSCCR